MSEEIVISYPLLSNIEYWILVIIPKLLSIDFLSVKLTHESKLTVPADAVYATGNYANPNIPTGTSDWKYYTGSPFNITVDSIIFGRVVYQTRNIKSGKVYFDDFKLEELNQSNQVVKTIYAVNPTAGNYWNWAENGTGSFHRCGSLCILICVR